MAQHASGALNLAALPGESGCPAQVSGSTGVANYDEKNKRA